MKRWNGQPLQDYARDRLIVRPHVAPACDDERKLRPAAYAQRPAHCERCGWRGTAGDVIDAGTRTRHGAAPSCPECGEQEKVVRL